MFIVSTNILYDINGINWCKYEDIKWKWKKLKADQSPWINLKWIEVKKWGDNWNTKRVKKNETIKLIYKKWEYRIEKYYI